MSRWFQALARTRQALADGFRALVGAGNRPDARTLETLEETLIRADVPARLAMDMIETARRAGGAAPFAERLEEAMLHLFADGSGEPAWNGPEKPRVILLTGVNGSGKTTTAAKLARRVKAAGLRPLLAAADTYRAAGTDQLRIWADRVGCECVSGVQGADAAAVAFDAVRAGVSRGADVVIVDTAGRMHTRHPLMEELRKVGRSAGKALPGAPHEVWMVLDAALGNNALSQARHFHDCLPLTGLIVAKLDGSSKAGFLLGVRKDLGVDVRYAGLGEGMDDLTPFEPKSFVRALLGREPDDEGGAG